MCSKNRKEYIDEQKHHNGGNAEYANRCKETQSGNFNRDHAVAKAARRLIFTELAPIKQAIETVPMAAVGI